MRLSRLIRRGMGWMSVLSEEWMGNDGYLKRFSGIWTAKSRLWFFGLEKGRS